MADIELPAGRNKVGGIASRIEYDVAEGGALWMIKKRVQQMLDEGWTFNGTLVVVRDIDENGFRFFQPMIRYSYSIPVPQEISKKQALTGLGIEV